MPKTAVQETFLKVQRSIASFRGQSSFVTWTFRILVNTCYGRAAQPLAKKKKLPRKTYQQREDAAPASRASARLVAHPMLRLALERAPD